MTRNKTFPRGGIEVPSYRELTASSVIHPLAFPSLAVVPLVQFVGAHARWVVEVGQQVHEDQLLAKGLGPDDLDVHSPTPGVIQEFREITLPDGGVTNAALIRLDGQFLRTGKQVTQLEWSASTPRELLERIRSCGVYLESSTLDVRVRLDSIQLPLDDLVINALQPEPYLNRSQKLLEQRFSALTEGIRILQRIYQPSRTHLAHDLEVSDSLAREWFERLDGVQLQDLQLKYPQSQSGILRKTLGTGRSTLILDVASVLSVRDAVVEGRPQVETTIILSGNGARNPGIYRVRIGMPLYEVLKGAGGIHPGATKILVGGPFQGSPVENLASPVIKSTQAVLVLTKNEVNSGVPRACIRCGSCVHACPVGLEPLNLYKLIRQGNVAQAQQEGLDYCIECGICSYVCPSRVPLVGTFHQSRQELSHG